MLTFVFLLLLLIGALALAYVNASGRAWGMAAVVALAISWGAHLFPLALNLLATVAIISLGLALAVPTLRRALISDAVLKVFRRLMPPMSSTERDALEAGTVWWDGELFSGRPNWRRLLDAPRPVLTDEEQRFLDNEVETLCGMTSDWETTNVYKDLPPHVWAYIKDKGFLGMIIPKEYGGL
ncbi:MAG: acyl-CoA dehydrogenase, partial [Betaproteobacteria bacterium]